MIFKLYDCDVGLVIRGVRYDFEHVQSVTVDDPERVRLARGANAGNKTGVSYREGLTEAKTMTMNIMGMPKELHDLLKEVYDAQERIDAYVISRRDGSSKNSKQSVLSQSPKQLNLDDSAESMNTAIILESFDTDEVHKS